MRSLFFLTFLIASSSFAIGQDLSDTVEVQRSFSPVFRQNGQRLKVRDLLEITRSNPSAFQEMRIAKSNYDASMVFGYVGGFLVGWPLGTALGGGKPNWALAAAGGGLILVSLPFSSGFAKHAMKAMAIYNDDLKKSARNPVKMNVGFSATGIKLQMKF
jgi:hypothetical protein